MICVFGSSGRDETSLRETSRRGGSFCDIRLVSARNPESPYVTYNSFVTNATHFLTVMPPYDDWNTIEEDEKLRDASVRR